MTNNELQQWEKIRTLGLYQPFASLMLHGKIETRWVAMGKKPPFKPGKYLLYSTIKHYTTDELIKSFGPETQHRASKALFDDPTRKMYGFALCIGDLVNVRLLEKIDEYLAFVPVIGHALFPYLGYEPLAKVQWALIFENIERIEPFPFKGKQGVGIFPKDQHHLIKPVSKTHPQ